MATTTNYGWTTPDDTALVKDGASAIRTLGSSVDTTTKALNPSTTLGDIEYRSSTANTNTRLGIGSSGQVLTVAAGVPSWATPSSSPLTTKGDLFTFSTVAARLPVGTNGQVLTCDSAEATGLKFATPSAASFVGAKAKRNGTSQSIANGTFTAVLFNAEDYDTDSIHDISTNTDRFTVPTGKGGKWAISASVLFTGSATGERRIAIYKNGSSANTDNRLSGQGTAGQTMAVDSVFNLVATDYLSVYVYQDSGGSLNIDGDIIYCAFSYLGA